MLMVLCVSEDDEGETMPHLHRDGIIPDSFHDGPEWVREREHRSSGGVLGSSQSGLFTGREERVRNHRLGLLDAHFEGDFRPSNNRRTCSVCVSPAIEQGGEPRGSAMTTWRVYRECRTGRGEAW
jgi:hypothetical protein